MKKKKKDSINKAKTVNYDVLSLQNDYIDEIKNNPEYSLEIDPKHEYDFDKSQIEFIKNYIQFKSIATAAELAGIDLDIGKQYFLDYNIQKEIRRIHSALYQRQFCCKLLSLDQISGYLSSLITDSYVPIKDQLQTVDKLKVVNLLLDINKMKAEGLQNPDIIIEKDINEQIKELSVDTIKQLLEQKDTRNKKQELVSEIDKDSNLTLEEKAYLETLSTTELLKIIDENNKGEKDE